MRFVFQLQVHERVKSVLIKVQGGVWENCKRKDCISYLLLSQLLLPYLWWREKRVCFVQFWGVLKEHTFKVPGIEQMVDQVILGYLLWRDFPGGSSAKEPTCQCRRSKRCEFNPCVGKVPWRMPWQPTPVFFPGESHWHPWWATVHGIAESGHN